MRVTLIIDELPQDNFRKSSLAILSVIFFSRASNFFFGIMKYSQIPSQQFDFYTRTWPAQGTKIATVVFVHGFAEHCDRYDHVFTKVSKAGIEVFSWDQRGFGQSATNKTAGVNGGWPQQIADIDHFVSTKRQEGVPQFLWGHSMGGGLTLKYALDGPHRSQVAGYIASSPLIEIPPAGRPNFLKETLVGDMLDGGKSLLLHENTSRFTAPLLLAHGDADSVCWHLSSKKFIEAIPSKDKTYKEYPESYHEIHNDLDRDVVIKDYIQWLVAHTKENAKL
ncbi:Serine hydrolase YJU3 [Taphrina deformans PYCC 5710]|uniref:Serine hydrolase YJU3 n=1 Tax=Taphrina deformans (strain PYCC 5710 / ATCC 11124 / CBS 356.35 / IMI 108563 / JCM 9778 / NBRC 8474) TaxID=1097556 RepID=R4X6R1_TAPDE|nr:Serine hydrolase YJU3 [Taphrina deformans PYCC 5710]|eukprot:CCG80886.1 Serine hydrolase YJU3 [Taphrina deformans PYCC 5710]